MTSYFKKDDIPSILGAINTYTLKLENSKDVCYFEKIAYLIKDNARSRAWITSPILSVVYCLYQEDIKWLVALQWLLKLKIPDIRINKSLPLPFLVALDNTMDILELFIDNGYDINERVKLKNGYVSIYNFIEPSKDSVNLIYKGGWRPTCGNSPTDLPNIILNEYLDINTISDILDQYFSFNNPNQAYILDNLSLLHESNLVVYLARRWNKQDKRILLNIMSDPRWTYDTIFYTININPTLESLLADELIEHDDRPLLFKNTKNITNYLQTASRRQESAYMYLSTDKNTELSSDQAYSWINNKWVDYIYTYLPSTIPKSLLYSPLFSERYIKVLSNWMNNKNILDNTERYSQSVHETLRVQMNVIAWIEENYWFSSWVIYGLYMKIMNI